VDDSAGIGCTGLGGRGLHILWRFRSLFASGSGFIMVVRVDASCECESTGHEPVLFLETPLREK
jgi:hypothetical protein